MNNLGDAMAYYVGLREARAQWDKVIEFSRGRGLREAEMWQRGERLRPLYHLGEWDELRGRPMRSAAGRSATAAASSECWLASTSRRCWFIAGPFRTRRRTWRPCSRRRVRAATLRFSYRVWQRAALVCRGAGRRRASAGPRHGARGADSRAARRGGTTASSGRPGSPLPQASPSSSRRSSTTWSTTRPGTSARA